VNPGVHKAITTPHVSSLLLFRSFPRPSIPRSAEPPRQAFWHVTAVSPPGSSPPGSVPQPGVVTPQLARLRPGLIASLPIMIHMMAPSRRNPAATSSSPQFTTGTQLA
jgi:hypothetical protein